MTTFYCRTAGSKFCFSDGKEAIFFGGKYETSIDSEIAELMDATKVAGSLIHTSAPETAPVNPAPAPTATTGIVNTQVLNGAEIKPAVELSK